MVSDDARANFAVTLETEWRDSKERHRGMPSKEQVKRNWAARLVVAGKFATIERALGPDTCFACGTEIPLGIIRAHIRASVEGGDNDVENIHLLCWPCHVGSELLIGDEYWRWFLNGGFLGELRQIVSLLGAHVAER